MRLRLLALTVLISVSGSAFAAQGADDALTFQTYCAICHMENAAAPGSPNEKAPTRAQLRYFAASRGGRRSLARYGPANRH